MCTDTDGILEYRKSRGLGGFVALHRQDPGRG